MIPHLRITSSLLALSLVACGSGGTDKGGVIQDTGGADDNVLPTAPVISLDPSAPYTTDDLVVSVTEDAVDADGDAVSYGYAWTVDGAVASDQTESTVPSSATTKGEVWSVTVTPSDAAGSGDAATAEVTIANTPPETLSATAGPDPAGAGDTLTCASGGTADVDGDVVTESFAWLVNGSEVATGEALAPGTFASGDAVVCVITPNDGEVDGEPVSSNTLTIANTPPETLSATAGPDPAGAGDTLACASGGTADVDGDVVTESFAWLVNGSEVATGDTLAPGAFASGDAVVCVITPNDGEVDGEPVSSNTLTIQNSAPVGTSADISPASPTTSDDLVATASGTDVDGDGLTWSYAWSINGTASATVADTLPSSETTRGDEIYVVATPNDGTEDGTPVTSATVTVVNAAPAATDVTLAPASAYTNDTLTATPTGADPDGDALTWTYAWYVDGTEVVGETGASLSGTLYFDRGQAVYVVATPSDSDAVGSSATSSTTTILNTVPTAPTVAISPSPAFESSDLVCEVDTASTDADGDAISYSFSWTVDGASTSATTTTVWPDDTILAAETTGGEEWICTATPDDGSASGATATDTITIQTWAGERIFTPCGVSGRTGPSQADCDAEYAGGTLDGEVTVATGIQTWTVPSSGDYLITAYGAQGASGDSSYVGGWGALSEGVLALTAGDVLYIAVGQEGVGQSSGSNGGGGGGSFVVDAAGTPLVVAGGGGGTRTNVSQDGCDAVASNYGVQGSASSRTSSCSVKTSEYGLGGVVSGGSWGSGGAGFYGNGDADYAASGGGSSWANGLVGGEDDRCGLSALGGFGGGGSGNGCYGGGGGGGFSGGDGGRVAGGGGSYVDSSATDIVRATGYNDGEGWVVIDVAE